MLAWYMSSSQNARFRLFEFDSANTVKEIGKVQEIPTTAGINKLKLPLDYPELTVGKTYLWQIAIDCENDTIIRRAEFIVTNPRANASKLYLLTTEVKNQRKISISRLIYFHRFKAIA
ncbi:RNA:NAD 2'-phosphotransferase [Nostoc flagelliforme CCNUN1]|uniref:RNA:NAD 2'-phosphotransferase n=2 Tax=Nostoc flagelliforme TaxID=1306274 RepID=A0A2K8SIN4_9NOSO|nr:RNA:NAD 2'-phosphotransferase [Nostoc flagelliforme CCNUN1]